MNNHHPHHHNQQIVEEEEVEDCEAMDDVEDVPSDSGYALVSAPPNPTIPLRGESSDQLTLSFQGEVYVFDSVSAEKVQAVLLLLGGYEIPSGVPTMSIPSQIGRSSGDNIVRRSSLPQRAASLNRFREKRKDRCFDKKIRYSVRKEVALRMQRKKGQFTSSKVNPDESSGLNGVDNPLQEKLCTHCGTSSKSTPMMRRGPDGPRTLCNACGLMWANKGILRVIPKPLCVATQNSSLVPIEQQGEAENSEIRTTGETFPTAVTSNGDDFDGQN